MATMQPTEYYFEAFDEHGITFTCQWDDDAGMYVLNLPQIDLSSDEAQDRDITSDRLTLSRDSNLAKSAFDYAATLARQGSDIYTIYTELASFIQTGEHDTGN